VVERVGQREGHRLESCRSFLRGHVGQRVLTEPRFFSKATVTVETDLGAGALGAKLEPVTMESGWQAL